MAFSGQAVAVAEVGVLHAQLLSAAVHLFHKSALAPGDLLRQRHGRVVPRRHRYGFQQVMNGHLLPFRQEHLAAAHGGGVGGTGDHILQVQLPLFDSLYHQQHGHDLGHRRRFPLFVLCLLV